MKGEHLIWLGVASVAAFGSMLALVFVAFRDRGWWWSRRASVQRDGDLAPPPGEDLVADLARFEQSARRVDRELAERAEQLVRLLAEADAKIDELHRLSEQARKNGAYAPRRPSERICAEVERLAEQDLDTVAIARHLGLSVGEVELVRQLRRAGKKPLETGDPSATGR